MNVSTRRQIHKWRHGLWVMGWIHWSLPGTDSSMVFMAVWRYIIHSPVKRRGVEVLQRSVGCSLQLFYLQTAAVFLLSWTGLFCQYFCWAHQDRRNEAALTERWLSELRGDCSLSWRGRFETQWLVVIAAIVLFRGPNRCISMSICLIQRVMRWLHCQTRRLLPFIINPVIKATIH